LSGRILSYESLSNMETIGEKLGNKIFAMETNLDSLRKRIKEGRVVEALEIVSSFELFISVIKNIIIDFKKGGIKWTNLRIWFMVL